MAAGRGGGVSKRATAPGQKKKAAGLQSARSFTPAGPKAGPMPGGKPMMGPAGKLGAGKGKPAAKPTGPNPLQSAATAIGTGRNNALAGLRGMADLAGKVGARASQGGNPSFGGNSINDAMQNAPRARRYLNGGR